ncbi:MAG: hypothetical protein AAF639_01910 [Chloroflexota bacterium]
MLEQQPHRNDNQTQEEQGYLGRNSLAFQALPVDPHMAFMIPQIEDRDE